MLSPEEWGGLEIKSFHSSWSWMSFEAMLEFHKPFASVFTYAVEKLEKTWQWVGKKNWQHCYPPILPKKINNNTYILLTICKRETWKS